ncbi:TonB family protein [Paraburkholderia sp. NPDC080076]|jgi:protein TonB|uniref:energy transducer TonB n=1 Tax=Paraburkholderia sp. NPDC080076 TaxID=3390605 RepID=UPI003CFE53C9
MRLTTTVDGSPKLRIGLAIFIALVLWLVFLFALGHWLDATTSEPAPDKPLEVRVVELDPPPAIHTEPTPVVKPPRPVEPRPHVVPRHTEAPAPRMPTPDRHPAQIAAPNETSAPADSPVHSTNSSEERQSTSQPAMSAGDAAARAIAQPLPELPDDLREQAYQTVATARFVIHADGSVDVELLKPTPNPRLNQLLLEALRKWRFFPALQSGRPVESRQDVRVHFNVN